LTIEKHFFVGGLDSDSAYRLIQQESYLNLMNGKVGITQYGRNNQVQNFPGTTAISQSVYPPYGTNICLGSGVDIDRTRILYAVCNTQGDHGIYCRDVASGTTYAVLYDSQVIGGLGFSKNSRIDKNMRVVGNLLYWTDNLNQPRRINIEAGIKMNHASYSTTVLPYSWPMNASTIAWIRRPFGLNITATKVTDGSITENLFKPFAGRFASRTQCRDGEYTVTSLPSNFLNYNYATDTFNAADVSFNINEDFDQDAQVIELLVGYDNNPNYFTIKKWDKSVAADAAAIAAHNAGSQALTFRFLNNVIGDAIGSADSVKPEDPVPITVKTIETALNRTFLANYTRGYNTPAQTSLLAEAYNVSNTDSNNVSCFKAFGNYQIGVRFRDYYSRKSMIVTNSSCVFTIADRNYDITHYITGLVWSLSNALASTEIPDWAYYYDIVITKNLRTRYFVDSRNLATQYVVKNSDGTFSYQNTYSTNLYGVSLDFQFSLTGYTFAEGDLCRVYVSGSSTVTEVPVLGQDGSITIIGLVNLGDLTTQPAVEFEIYTPHKQLATEPFYTTGNTYLVTNSGLSNRTYSTLGGTISGDIYRQKKVYNFGFFTINVRFETMSPANDINPIAWFNIYGQEGIISSLGQVYKPNYVMFSDTRIQGTRVNGLSSFEALNEKALPEAIGAISKIQLANKIQEQGSVMLAIGEIQTASMYLGEVQVVGASKNAFLAQDTGVIGTINILQGSYGTTMPSSVIEYLGLVFWYDLINGCWVQYSTEGLEEVSRNKMTRFFKNYANSYLSSNANNLDNINGFHHIPGFVDPFHKEVGAVLPALIYENYAATLPSYSSVPSYATSIINRFDIFDQLGKRISFKYEKNLWENDSEGLGEQYEYIADRMFSWKAGNMWEHNTNTTNWNTIYGVQYPVRLCFVANLNPSLLKVLNNITVEGSVTPGFAVAMALVPNTQITDLASNDEAWVNQQGNRYAAWLKDRLSPNASGTADEKLFSGDSITDIAILIMIEMQEFSNLAWVQSIDIGYSASRGQKQIVNP
jgi:hypothetical protein